MNNKMNNTLNADAVVRIFEDAVENRKTAIEYKPFNNPTMLIWNMLLGNEESLTIMLQGKPLMSNHNGRNTISFRELKIYLLSQSSIKNSGLSNILDLPALTVENLKPAVKIYFDKHNSMAAAEYNDHHVFFNLE